jgi:hypothetical protein
VCVCGSTTAAVVCSSTTAATVPAFLTCIFSDMFHSLSCCFTCISLVFIFFCILSHMRATSYFFFIFRGSAGAARGSLSNFWGFNMSSLQVRPWFSTELFNMHWVAVVNDRSCWQAACLLVWYMRTHTLHICECMRMFMCACTYMCMYMCMCMCMCMWIATYLSMGVCMHLNF